MTDRHELIDERLLRAPQHDRAQAPATGEHPLHALQRSVGNAAVVEAVESDDEGRSPVLDVVGRGGGRALPAEVQRSMSAAFGGTDFSDVRLHDDGAAKASAQAVGARAYTTGHEIVLGDGVDIASPDGQRTLAHELTHVVQQRSGPVDGTDSGDGVSVSDPGDRFEREAEADAERITSGEVAVAPTPTAAVEVQREALPEEDDETVAEQREVLPGEDEEPL